MGRAGGVGDDYFFFLHFFFPSSYATVRPHTPHTPSHPPPGGGTEPAAQNQRPPRGESPASRSILHIPSLLLSPRWVGSLCYSAGGGGALASTRTRTTEIFQSRRHIFRAYLPPCGSLALGVCRRDARLQVTRQRFEKKEKKKKTDGKDASVFLTHLEHLNRSSNHV